MKARAFSLRINQATAKLKTTEFPQVEKNNTFLKYITKRGSIKINCKKSIHIYYEIGVKQYYSLRRLSNTRSFTVNMIFRGFKTTRAKDDLIKKIKFSP